MKVLDFNLSSEKNGGKVTGFNYSRSLNELVSSWSASVAGGNFKAGNSISFNGVMTDGIISRAYKDSFGLWHIEGKDAGVKLMKTTPDISDLPTGNAKAVITYLANFCSIPLSMSGNGLSNFNTRSLISGSTCAEAILELAMLSGYIAYINNNGALVLTTPSSSVPSFNNIIDDSGSDVDLDGYATQVLVSLTCRTEDSESETETTYTSGTTPSANPDEITYSGSLSNGSFSVTMWGEPYNVIKRVKTTVINSGITIETEEIHNYEYKSKTVTRDNNNKEKQEYLLIAFYESGYQITKTIEGTYNEQNFKEVTTETLTRSTGGHDVPNPPEDWLTSGTPKMIDEENLTRTTVRTGAPAPKEGMPPYSPSFDCKVKKKFYRKSHGFKTLVICEEEETRYEERQVGSISPVKVDDELIPHFMFDSKLAIQTHSTPQWVPIKTHRTYCDLYDANNECKASTRSEYSDDGAEWLSENAISDTGDEELNKYEKAYAAFTQNSQGLEITLGSSQVETFWQFVELPGKKTITKKQGEVDLGDVSSWYDNGEYVQSLYICPHVNGEKPYQCNVCTLDSSNNTTNCTKTNSYGLFPMKFDFRDCERAKKALEEARKQDEAEVTSAFIGTASKDGANVGYQRDIYIDEYLGDNKAQNLANTIAANILKVKSNKGIRKTVVVPYDTSYLPNGSIVEVSHDWANMQTSVTYREDGDIPEFMITQSMASVASFVSTRENARSNIPKYGVVTKCTTKKINDEFPNDNLVVKVGNKKVPCTTRLKNIAKDDIVLVAFAAGNKLRGQVIARL